MPLRSVRHFLEFIKSTVVGGLFVLVPLVLLLIAVGHAVQFAYELVLPLIRMLPVKTVSTVSLAFFVGIAAVVLCCFLAGLLAQTAILRWLVRALEHLILTFVPSYGLMKSMGHGWLGVEAEGSHPSVLVRLDDAYQIGFVMDTLPDSRQVVFLPDVPNPWTGSLIIVDADRVTGLPLSTKQTIECFRKLGAHTSRLLSKLQSST